MSLKPDEIRASFLEGLSRVCLSLGLGHFLCVVPLCLMFGDESTPVFSHYITTITTSGILLTVIAFLCRYRKMRVWLAVLSLGLLFVQSAVHLWHGNDLFHPVTMLFPLLCALSTPILGRRASYVTAALSAALLLFFFVERFHLGLERLPGLLLFDIVLFFSAHVSEMLWTGVLEHEAQLGAALAELERKREEMESWLRQLGHASSLISSGQLGTTLPEPPQSQVFQELTHSLGEMRAQLHGYFTQLFLEDRLNSLGVLATGVAHELNTPLTSMRFLIQGDERIPQETRELLDAEVVRMSLIARALLAFARPGERTRLDLSELVRTSSTLLSRANDGKVRVEYQLGELRHPIEGMGNEIQQVLLNLFQNAVDALEGSESPLITIATSESPGAVELTLVDNGCGIREEALSRVLDPFFTTKPPGKGTGLGLFITHQIMRKHGGSLLIESRPGEGTRVRLLFPVASAAAAGSRAA